MRWRAAAPAALPALPMMLLAAGLLAACASAPESPATRVRAAAAEPALDWDARYLLVHFDPLGDGGVATFEGARRRWLDRLRADGGSLADGRPLYFSSDDAGGRRTEVSVYPFGDWPDLAARARAKAAVEKRVGPTAVADYDAGDAALVPPHRYEIWTRLAENDIVSTGAPDGLARAGSARLEARVFPMGTAADGFDALWTKVRREASARGISCRVYWSLFGSGDLILVWTASGGAGPDLPPELAAELDRIAPLERRFELVRRDDLSTLAPVTR